MKLIVEYASTRTDRYLIVAIRKSQHARFQVRHDYRLTTAFTNEILKMRARAKTTKRSVK
jgi:hypothetical protein